ncbi:hypothetical protein [Candidatus Amarolinea dominans]|uniref:hypothetical protein n=1 Tax=Candidatus Amarolinea dominans TaxID=3140696 RepID=UPI0031368715|nr:hypothetical protein [Anaerolineae bacterium]
MAPFDANCARIVAQEWAAVNPKLRVFWQAASGGNVVTGGRGDEGPASGSIAQRHPPPQLAKWQRRYETLSKRIAALDKDLGRTLDSETKVVLEERRQELAAAREQAAEGIAQIEKMLWF